VRSLKIPVWTIVLAAAILAAGCGAAAIRAYSGPSPSDARKHAVENRADNFNRAASLVPDPHNTNFPLRRALREFSDREDLLHHPWYVYLLGDNGNTIGYYVAKYPPENSCNFLSSTQDVYHDDHGNLPMQSPSYDGVYYGGSVCDEWFIFDAATNALVKFRGFHYYVADQPLRVDAKPIKVATP
jgi:hypothetical protein